MPWLLYYNVQIYSVKHYAYNDRITNDSTAHVHVCTVYGKTA